METTIGGNRVGSGKKMKAHLHNYFRSTHNLSEKFASSMGSGILYPCLCKLAMRGDSFDIDIAADCRTIPTQGPLFGSYKMQIDIYQVPVRLYQGILHNNPMKVGLNMSKVNFPVLRIGTYMTKKKSEGKINDSALLKYLGLSGIGIGAWEDSGKHYAARDINAIPALSYYDIFKNYYANKQEENAYVISRKFSTTTKEIKILSTYNNNYEFDDNNYIYIPSNFPKNTNARLTFTIEGVLNVTDRDNVRITFNYNGDETQSNTLEGLWDNDQADININNEGNTEIGIKIYDVLDLTDTPQSIQLSGNTGTQTIDTIDIVPFNLSNIDDMRYDLLSHNRLGETFVIRQNTGEEDDAYLPYKTLVATTNEEEGITLNNYPLNGLVLKTYQNDIFNNWLNSEQIEGEGSITELTQVSVTEGKFSMDALSFAEKLYNMLNRIAVAGNTYEDWQDVVYEEAKRRQIESPIFLGGMSQEVMFDEIVQNAPTNIDGNEQPLGTLGGRGRLIETGKKGGKIHVKVDEASFIIGIVSLTPRVMYSQGNEFYMTDIKTMDDLHKPAMDGIGFQDLIGERLAWWDTHLARPTGGQPTSGITRSKIGKLPAWIEYMTSTDKCYGDFAGEYGDKAGFMVLNRNYEFDESTGGIKDATTYVDPSKFNYAFADTKLEAQNFWVEIAFKIKARRLMSAKLIPSV